MPVDLMIYKEVFGVKGAKDNNIFFKKYSIKHEAKKSQNSKDLEVKIAEIEQMYSSLQVNGFSYPGM